MGRWPGEEAQVGGRQGQAECLPGRVWADSHSPLETLAFLG